MLAVKNLVIPARQISLSRRFISGDTHKTGKSKRHTKDLKTSQDSTLPQDSSSSNFFKNDEDLHGYGLDEQTATNLKTSLFSKDTLQQMQSDLTWSKDEQKTYSHPIKTGIDKFSNSVENGKTSQRSKDFAASKDTADAAGKFASNSEKFSSIGQRMASMTSGAAVGSTITQSLDNAKDMANNAVERVEEAAPSIAGNVKETIQEGVDQFSKKMSGMAESITNAMPMDSISNMSEKIAQKIPTMETVTHAKDAIKEKIPSMDDVKGMAASIKDHLPSMPKSVSETSETVRESMPSMGSVASAANSVKDSMPSMPKSVEGLKDSVADASSSLKDSLPNITGNIADKVSTAKQTVNATVENVASSGVFESFRQGMATMKEAMMPIIETASEKLKEGAQVAAEKIPPLASSLKENLKSTSSFVAEKADQAMHSQAAESIKESVTGSAKGAFESLKEKASTILTGQKLDIQENTVTKPSGQKAEIKDQEMASSDVKSKSM